MRQKTIRQSAMSIFFIVFSLSVLLGCYNRNSPFGANNTTSATFSNQTIPYQYSETTEIDSLDDMAGFREQQDRESEQVYREQVILLLTEIRDLLRESNSSPENPVFDY